MPLPTLRAIRCCAAMVGAALLPALIGCDAAARAQVMRAPGYYLPPAKGSAPPHASSAPSRGSNLLDLNTATVAQLSSLPGMGAVYARRVIAGRPYHAKNQLVRRGILPAAEYARISGLIVAHRATASSTGAAPTSSKAANAQQR